MKGVTQQHASKKGSEKVLESACRMFQEGFWEGVFLWNLAGGGVLREVQKIIAGENAPFGECDPLRVCPIRFDANGR